MNSRSLLNRRALAAAVLSAGLAAACGGADVTSSTSPSSPAAAGSTDAPDGAPSATATAMPSLRREVDPTIVAALREEGLTIATLPADLDELHEPGHARMRAVMKTFTIALGTTCDGCHVKGAETDEELRVDTPRKRVAKKMWTRFVMGLEQRDGRPLYCDGCHQGKMTFLDRSDRDFLATWMKANFVDALDRKDGKEHGCATCHGEVAGTPFLDGWRQR